MPLGERWYAVMKRALLFFFQALFVDSLGGTGQADIVFTVESPASNQILTGITGFSGWTFSTVPGAHVTVQATIDGQTIINGLRVTRCSVAPYVRTLPGYIQP